MGLRKAVVIGGLTLAPLLPAVAQAVRGTAVDQDSVPVSGVVVLLMDASGRITSRALTNDAGEFRVAGDAPGAYRLRTLRIGFRPIVSDPVMLDAGEEVSRRIVLTGVPFSLDTVRVHGRSMCQLTPDRDTLTYGIWEQVRAALSAAQVTSKTRGFTATLVTYDRTTDPNGRRVRRESATIKSGFTTRPWYSLPADSLRRVGYVTADATGGRTYYAPDLDVLLSDVFLDDHCFQLRESSDPARIGIAFEPSKDRNDVAEIKGTVWLERRSAELRAMDFEYVHFNRERAEGRSGGEMEFARMRNNAWAISRWNIRMPAVTHRFMENSGVPGMPSTPQIRVIEVKVTGGELVLVTRGSDTLLAGAPLVLSGVVEDSVSGRAIEGGRVALRGTKLVATTDAAGRFRISPVLPGQHSIEVRTAALDSIASPHVAALTFTSATETHRVRVPPVDSVAFRLCSSWTGSGQRALGLLIGTLAVRGESVPPVNVNVGAQWNDLTARNQGATQVVVAKTPRLIEGRTDSTGTFRLCGVPVNTALDIRSELSTATLAHDVLIPPGVRWTRVSLVAERPSGKGVAGATLSGHVLAQQRRQPLIGAEVSIAEAGLVARTDSGGAFRLADIPAGVHTVTVRQLGFASQSVALEFSPNTAVERDFVLTNAQVLDSVVVAGKRANLPEFEERRKMAIGHFITREELEKQENHRMSEILIRMGGLGIERAAGGNQAWVKAGRGQLTKYDPDAFSAAMGAKPACYVDVWVDGVRVYSGIKGQPLFDVNSLLPGILEGVEYYAGAAQIPAKYSRVNQDCGVLVLWTRRGP